MTNAAEEWTEEERAEKIAEDTGGGIVCVVIPHTDGGFISWGTADVTWGAVITDPDGEQVSSISTDWLSDSEDTAAAAKALLDASLRNGAARAGA